MICVYLVYSSSSILVKSKHLGNKNKEGNNLET